MQTRDSDYPRSFSIGVNGSRTLFFFFRHWPTFARYANRHASCPVSVSFCERKLHLVRSLLHGRGRSLLVCSATSTGCSGRGTRGGETGTNYIARGPARSERRSAIRLQLCTFCLHFPYLHFFAVFLYPSLRFVKCQIYMTLFYAKYIENLTIQLRRRSYVFFFFLFF